MKEFNAFIESLKARVNNNLPGLPAQLKMAPVSRAKMMEQIDTQNARKAAVLILFYPDNGVRTVFIERQDYDGIHSGQISFPGGQFEEPDTSLQDTAVRETFEEIGVRSKEVNIIGNLTELYIPPSNFMVYPVLGYTAKVPDFSPDPQEVKKIISVYLGELTMAQTRQERFIETSYQDKIKVPCYMIDGHMIWGATAMMVSELIELVNS